MNWPNILTCLRFVLTIGFIFFARIDGLYAVIVATAFFTSAAITDFLDGYIARKYQLFTDFGKIMDPIADKFLILSAFFIFMQMHYIPVWMFYLVAVREILVTASRLLLMSKGQVIAAETEGKLKTVLQIVAVFLILSFRLAQSSFSGATVLEQQGTMFWWYCLIQVVMLVVTIVTTYSGLKYFWNNRLNLR